MFCRLLYQSVSPTSFAALGIHSHHIFSGFQATLPTPYSSLSILRIHPVKAELLLLCGSYMRQLKPMISLLLRTTIPRHFSPCFPVKEKNNEINDLPHFRSCVSLGFQKTILFVFALAGSIGKGVCQHGIMFRDRFTEETLELSLHLNILFIFSQYTLVTNKRFLVWLYVNSRAHSSNNARYTWSLCFMSCMFLSTIFNVL